MRAAPLQYTQRTFATGVCFACFSTDGHTEHFSTEARPEPYVALLFLLAFFFFFRLVPLPLPPLLTLEAVAGSSSPITLFCWRHESRKRKRRVNTQKNRRVFVSSINWHPEASHLLAVASV